MLIINFKFELYCFMLSNNYRIIRAIINKFKERINNHSLNDLKLLRLWVDLKVVDMV